MTRGITSTPEERWGIFFAISAAFTVALYTLWGREVVRHMHPFLYMYCYTLATCLFFGPALKRLDKNVIAHEWQVNKWRIVAVSFLNTFSYVLNALCVKLEQGYLCWCASAVKPRFWRYAWLVIFERTDKSLLAYRSFS